MGFYSALFHSEAISFQDGILLIQKAYELINNDLKKQKYTMASIVGLDLNDINKILKKSTKKVAIANVNNKTSFVISGASDEIKKAMVLFKKEGAISVKELPINTPYHTQFITKNTKDLFSDFIKKIKIKKPVYKIISGINQRVINTKEEIAIELVNNLFKMQDWHKTMNKLITLKNETFFESGPGKSLSKISRFIDGKYRIYTIKEINEVIS
jgi:malonyl CoA-acyl carrier protein transacylase